MDTTSDALVWHYSDTLLDILRLPHGLLPHRVRRAGLDWDRLALPIHFPFGPRGPVVTCPLPNLRRAVRHLRGLAPEPGLSVLVTAPITAKAFPSRGPSTTGLLSSLFIART